jgi:hypothetical protein
LREDAEQTNRERVEAERTSRRLEKEKEELSRALEKAAEVRQLEDTR